MLSPCLQFIIAVYGKALTIALKSFGEMLYFLSVTALAPIFCTGCDFEGYNKCHFL